MARMKRRFGIYCPNVLPQTSITRREQSFMNRCSPKRMAICTKRNQKYGGKWKYCESNYHAQFDMIVNCKIAGRMLHMKEKRLSIQMEPLLHENYPILPRMRDNMVYACGKSLVVDQDKESIDRLDRRLDELVDIMNFQ
mmetsp:Transcript_29152/g.34669  ORF Transcript_29152/g.34669 Transcript_29152/m.34669 type:complete len:139 (-) Transcript_29152:176-592(-)|eukprot:CAMPEP_0198248662 /NCGR_PEP_ID=MMETSP1447-20131203/399_1 /TAXON_ID=420782 /ORGANISM="Chaetoceros dichaeta, Strain CCMP1751" /LENGTH=138 /DNA_ID=CAMNT_0043933127 /DNA_START=34 /DNA_END=450 /DNA_ORIENTATION=+